MAGLLADGTAAGGLADLMTAAILVVVGAGLALQGFVFATVAILRGMTGRSRHRRIVLPLAGIASGWVFTAAVLLFLGQEWSPRMAALVFLAGFWAYVVAAGLHSQNKDARGETR